MAVILSAQIEVHRAYRRAKRAVFFRRCCQRFCFATLSFFAAFTVIIFDIFHSDIVDEFLLIIVQTVYTNQVAPKAP
jgi:hypothetical protein